MLCHSNIALCYYNWSALLLYVNICFICIYFNLLHRILGVTSETKLLDSLQLSSAIWKKQPPSNNIFLLVISLDVIVSFSVRKHLWLVLYSWRIALPFPCYTSQINDFGSLSFLFLCHFLYDSLLCPFFSFFSQSLSPPLSLSLHSGCLPAECLVVVCQMLVSCCTLLLSATHLRGATDRGARVWTCSSHFRRSSLLTCEMKFLLIVPVAS